MEVLSFHLLQAQDQRECRNIKVARDAPPINHLSFPNDAAFITTIQ